ncbi:hypothetical protein Ancab_000177 [Ancistrocladus abbreviatus]
MASRLINVGTHETQNPLELSLREAYDLLAHKLKTPVKLTIPSPSEYLNLNRAIIYGVLCDTHMANTYMKHLHAIVSDGFCIFVKLLVQITDELYSKMVESVRVQLIWVTSVMIDVGGIGFGNLLVSLLRQIISGDCSEGNLWLSFELVALLMSKWDLILDEEPFVLTSALYTYLRLLADHYRLPSNPRSGELKQKEIEFCVRTLREQFHLCMKIGRDLMRLLQDLIHISEFRVIWKDLLLNPGSFKTSEFSDVSLIYRVRTSSRYHLLRVTPEMESQLRFLLTYVKLGSQKRHQAWFSRKFLFSPERETLICDIVRFICCGHHPSNEIIHSDVIPRWAVIGWLLKCCRKRHVEANVKLSLFYDWLFFDDTVDNIMNIEPAMLLMVNSIPRYVDMTHELLEFLILLVENYDVERKNIIFKGVSSALDILVRKGVIRSLDVLTSCDLLSPLLRDMLQELLFRTKAPVPLDLQAARHPAQSVPSLSPFSVELQMAVPSGNVDLCVTPVEASVPISTALATSCIPFSVNNESQIDVVGDVIQTLGKNMTRLNELEKALMLYVNHDSSEACGLSPEVLACKLDTELGLKCELFAPLECLPNTGDFDDEVQSGTAVIIRTFIFSQHPRIREMLLYWSRNARPVGARLLSYAVRLAYEAHMAGYMVKSQAWNNDDEIMPLLKIHLDAYFAFVSGNGDDMTETFASTANVDKKLILKLVNRAFSSYKSIHTHSRDVSSEMSAITVGKLLSADIISCSEWKKKRFSLLFQSIFLHLPDLAASDEDVVRLLVSHLEHADLVSLQIDVGLKRFSIFGDSVQAVLQLVRSSICWGPIEQHKLWGLIRSEFSVTNFLIEKLLFDVFCVANLDPSASSIAVGGLLTLCSSCTPTPELVGAVMLLPSDKFPEFAAAVLANWITCNSTMLFNSIAEFLDKLQKKNENIAMNWIGMINRSAVLYLLDYLERKDGAVPVAWSLPSQLCVGQKQRSAEIELLRNPYLPTRLHWAWDFFGSKR